MNILPRAVNAFKKGLNSAQAILLTCYKTFEMGYESMGFESAKPKACQLHGKSYPHGSEIMADAKILKCVDGQWQERVNPLITVGP
jgi:hypothetical protein